MWTPVSRRQHSREHLRYGSDLTDAEWAIIAPSLPAPRRTGRPRRWPMRELMNAMFYVLRSGCPWRMVPANFAPHSTVYRWFLWLRDERVFETINHHLLIRDRERVGREPSPSAAVLDSQSVKTTEAGGPRGYDAGKKINGRKRHLLTDTLGLPVAAAVHPADIQDRDGAPIVLAAARFLYPWLRHVPRLREGRLLPMAVTAGPSWLPPSTRSATGRLRSSSAAIRRQASWSCPDVGLSSAPWLGSIATAVSPKTLKPAWKALSLGYSSPASNYSCVDWVIIYLTQ